MPEKMPQELQDHIHRTITEICREIASVMPTGTVAAFAIKIPGMEAFCSTNLGIDDTRAFLIMVAATMTPRASDEESEPFEARSTNRMDN